ncbi:hypothetical protein FVR03_17110 [Pontibacter qinzhouensis]|uniref:Uncharacterized protein n=1 Tax=Pontibacter qinzhouensis TaxID=2603253 RepID=A0A5C8JGG8_9BACT|nr:hypothetical protein [Pontibacter qinzhouensis]TXK36698.1 hypothetical protein FVR03_17110 [Pontibacter qinzhouensis]
MAQQVAPAPQQNLTPCQPDKAGAYDFYSNLKTWVPKGGDLPLQNAPLKVMQLNFNIFQRSDSSGNFQDTPEDRAALLHYIARLNEIYSNVIAPSDPVPGTDSLPGNDTRFRFDIGPPGQERIYFYQNDSLNRSHNASLLLHNIKKADPERANQLNILFTDGYYMARVDRVEVTAAGSGYTSAPKVVFSPKSAVAKAIVTEGKVTAIELQSKGLYYEPEVEVTLEGGGGSGARATGTLTMGANGFTRPPSYTNFNSESYVMLLKHKTFPSATVLAHELAHTLDLQHLFEGYYCNSRDFLEDIYTDICPHKNKGWEVDPFAEVGDGVTNNLMMFAPDHFTYISPMQAGIMHRASALTDTRRYIAEAYSEVPYVLTSAQTWDFDMRLYQDLVLNQGADLTLSCALTMPIRSAVTVNAGGKLVLQGQLKAFSPKHWEGGIQVKKGGVLELRATTLANYNVTVERGGTLFIPAEASVALQQNGRLTVARGAYVVISEAASFALPAEADQALNIHRKAKFKLSPALNTSAESGEFLKSAAALQVLSSSSSASPNKEF